MNYFDIYFQGTTDQKIFTEKGTPELKESLNNKDAKSFFQEFYNSMFNLWVLSKKLAGNAICHNRVELINREDFPDVSDTVFEQVKDFLILSSSLYFVNWFFDKENQNPYGKLFNFDGIINSLNKLEADPTVFFINKHSIINILDTFLYGKWIDLYLRESAPFKDNQGNIITNKHIFDKIFLAAEKYNFKKIDYASGKNVLESSAINDQWAYLKAILTAQKNSEPDEYMRHKLLECIYNFRKFRKEVLTEISKYIITEEELIVNKDLFKMNHRKRLLLYDLLRYLEPERKLPADEKAYRYDKRFSTPRFDDFKRNEVRKYFS